MKTPEIPLNEPYRLQALRALNILDTQREERFDRLTRLTRRLFQVPIALLSFTDEDRVWFKSTAGADFTEIPRNISFCGHAILDEGIFMVEDLSRDARFADNPGVTDGGLRFYAGCPLCHPDGSRIGTLSICDHQPRTLNPDELETLRDLTGMVESELRAAHLATLDELCNINNRRGFLNLADQTLKLCKRQDTPASLIFFDLDEFKSINDRYGHDAGDCALREFADCLRAVFRSSDIIARLSGDEFVVLLPNTPLLEVEEVRNRIEEMIRQRNSAAKGSYKITFSCGMVEFSPQQHITVEDLLKTGDALMYQSKQQRKKIKQAEET